MVSSEITLFYIFTGKDLLKEENIHFTNGIVESLSLFVEKYKENEKIWHGENNSLFSLFS